MKRFAALPSVTDERGLYSFSGLQAGIYSISFTHQQYVPVTAHHITVSGNISDLVSRTVARERISGLYGGDHRWSPQQGNAVITVRDIPGSAMTGLSASVMPSGNVQIGYLKGDSPPEPEWPERLEADKSRVSAAYMAPGGGQILLYGLKPGKSYTFTLSSPGYVSVPVTVNAAGSGWLDEYSVPVQPRLQDTPPLTAAVYAGGEAPSTAGQNATAPALEELRTGAPAEAGNVTPSPAESAQLLPELVAAASKVTAGTTVYLGGAFTGYNAPGGITRLSKDGSDDLSFTGGAGANGAVSCMAVQKDGKILIGGDFTSYNGNTCGNIIRLNIDGTPDPSFNEGQAGADGKVSAILPAEGGSIVIGGDFTSYNGRPCGRIARLYADGSPDLSFNAGLAGADNSVNCLGVQSDGLIIAAGRFGSYNGSPCSAVIRIESDGSQDISFNHNGTGPDNAVEALAVERDDRIMLGGRFTAYNDIRCNFITRLDRDGDVDRKFNSAKPEEYGMMSPGASQSAPAGADNTVYTIAVDNDGSALIGGDFTSYNGKARGRFARLNSDGTLDESFDAAGTGADGRVCGAGVLSDGSLIVGGRFTHYDGAASNCIARLRSDGSVDSSFRSSGPGAEGSVNGIAIVEDDRIIAAGSFNSFNSSRRLIKLSQDGTADPSFKTGAGADSDILSSAAQADGSILIAGRLTAFNGVPCGHIARIGSDGAVDGTFNPGGAGADGDVYTVKVLGSGMILIGGPFTSYNGVHCGHIARLDAEGNLDATFNAGRSGAGGPGSYIGTIAPAYDGEMMIGGRFSAYNGLTCGNIARLNADGTPNLLFNNGKEGFNNDVYSIALTDGGRIIAGGAFTSYGGAICNYMTRLEGDGRLDPSFNRDGAGPDNIVVTLSRSYDGRLMAGGAFTSYNDTPCGRIVLLNNDGTPDAAFNSGGAGADDTITCIDAVSYESITIAGSFKSYNGFACGSAARLDSSGRPDSAFNRGGAGADDTVYSVLVP